LFPQCGDPVLQRPQANPQHLCGQFAIAAHVSERELDVSRLEFHEWLAWLEHDRVWIPDDADQHSETMSIMITS
jgi:hypothetical protein